MLHIALKLSLQITAIYVLFQQTMLFGNVGIYISNLLDRTFGSLISKKLQMPLFGCLICMSSFWTMALSITDIIDATKHFGFLETAGYFIRLMLCVCGINVLIDKILSYYETIA